MSLDGIKVLASGGLDSEIATFLMQEGFVISDKGWTKIVGVIDNHVEWWIHIQAGAVRVSERYGHGEYEFEFIASDHASFVKAYNAMVDTVRESKE